MSLIIGVISAAAAIVICLGYNVFYFELALPNGQTAQLLDVMDYYQQFLPDAFDFFSYLYFCGMGYQAKMDTGRNGI